MILLTFDFNEIFLFHDRTQNHVYDCRIVYDRRLHFSMLTIVKNGVLNLRKNNNQENHIFLISYIGLQK